MYIQEEYQNQPNSPKKNRKSKQTTNIVDEDKADGSDELLSKIERNLPELLLNKFLRKLKSNLQRHLLRVLLVKFLRKL